MVYGWRRVFRATPILIHVVEDGLIPSSLATASSHQSRAPGGARELGARRRDLLVNSEDRDLLKVQTVVIASPEPAMHFLYARTPRIVRLQWQVIMKAGSIAPASASRPRGQMSFGLGALVLWARASDG